MDSVWCGSGLQWHGVATFPLGCRVTSRGRFYWDVSEQLLHWLWTCTLNLGRSHCLILTQLTMARTKQHARVGDVAEVVEAARATARAVRLARQAERRHMAAVARMVQSSARRYKSAQQRASVTAGDDPDLHREARADYARAAADYTEHRKEFYAIVFRKQEVEPGSAAAVVWQAALDAAISMGPSSTGDV